MPKRVVTEVFAEQHVARRITLERQRRGWSYEGLAARMTAVGVPLNQSAIYKIERGNPPRRITVDELVGYARVFRLKIEEMLTDPEAPTHERAAELMDRWRRLELEREDFLEEHRSRLSSLREDIKELAHSSPFAFKAMERWLPEVFGDADWINEVADEFTKILYPEAGR